MDEEWHTLNHLGMLTNQEGVSGKYERQTWAAFTWRSDLTWLDANAVVSSSVTTQTA
jgi:hypothetical protein